MLSSLCIAPAPLLRPFDRVAQAKPFCKIVRRPKPVASTGDRLGKNR